jgi:carboxylesterase type B
MKLPVSFVLLSSTAILAAKVSVKLNDVSIVTGVTEGGQCQFLGVPYARRISRFGALISNVHPTADIDATHPGSICPILGVVRVAEGAQVIVDTLGDTGDAPVDELNCLNLDIYAPAGKRKQELRRVVIYVHGGGMDSGSRYQEFNRADLVHRFDDLSNVIWVNVGYSLGPLGFWHVDSQDGRFVSNAALVELVEALRWVQTHIRAFGGNASDVTLMGHSAGAALSQMVQIMLGSLEKYGFKEAPFQKLALMGGSALLFPPVPISTALARQELVIEKTKCHGLNDQDLINCLEKLEIESLIDATMNVNVMWSPILDGVNISKSPEESLAAGEFLPSKVLFTVNRNDSSFFCIRYFERISEVGLGLWSDFGHDHIAEKLRDQYRDSELSIFDQVECTTTDAIFVGPALNCIDLYQRNQVEASSHLFEFEMGTGMMNAASVGASLLSPICGLFGKSCAKAIEMKEKAESFSEAKRVLETMGIFHGLEQALLFNARFNGECRVDTLCSPKNAKTGLRALFEFINNGTTNSAHSFDGHSCAQVNLGKVVSILYTGKEPIHLKSIVDDQELREELGSGGSGGELKSKGLKRKEKEKEKERDEEENEDEDEDEKVDEKRRKVEDQNVRGEGVLI